jgi:HlyD family secretion protein
VTGRRGHRWGAAPLVLLALVTAGCSSDPGPQVTLGPVTSGEVVETVAAPARLEPRDRVVVEAPASGTVAELLVADGDVVTAGDPLVRLTAPTIDQSIAQAEAAVEAADALSGVQAGIDLSPILDAVSSQLEAVVPDLLQALAEQAATIPDEAQREQVNASIRDAIDTYNESQAGLQRAAREAEQTAASATASQRAAAEAQRRQAELALDAARSRADDLLVIAPGAGVVELARGGADDTAGALGDLEGLAGAEGLDAGSLGDVGGLLGGDGGPTTRASGPIAVGAQVASGQRLMTLFDLGAFRAVSRVDEIDVVRVTEGQDALVLVDAFPEAELHGVVEHVAIEPEAGTTGGVSFPVTVRLEDVPDSVALRVGLSGSVEVVTAVVESDTVVPSSALRRRGERDVVVVARDGTLAEVDVVVDAIGDDSAAVTGDVERGDLVVVEGIDEVADGDPVPEGAVTEDAAPARG